MKLYFHHVKGGNFGDDLNQFLWQKLFGELIGNSDDDLFIGIGSIFDNRLAELKQKKIVFGTGLRCQRTLPRIDDSYDIRFLRGPVSSQALGRNDPWISDP